MDVPVETEAEVLYHKSRLSFVSAILKNTPDLQGSRSRQAQDQSKIMEYAKRQRELFEQIKTQIHSAFPDRSSSVASANALDLATDIEKECIPAVETEDDYWRWGRHYLPAFARAHLHQQCSNFIDVSVQVYGRNSPLFQAKRDEADALFDNLPPPVPRARIQYQVHPTPPSPPQYVANDCSRGGRNFLTPMAPTSSHPATGSVTTASLPDITRLSLSTPSTSIPGATDQLSTSRVRGQFAPVPPTPVGMGSNRFQPQALPAQQWMSSSRPPPDGYLLRQTSQAAPVNAPILAAATTSQFPRSGLNPTPASAASTDTTTSSFGGLVPLSAPSSTYTYTTTGSSNYGSGLPQEPWAAMPPPPPIVPSPMALYNNPTRASSSGRSPATLPSPSAPPAPAPGVTRPNSSLPTVPERSQPSLPPYAAEGSTH